MATACRLHSVATLASSPLHGCSRTRPNLGGQQSLRAVQGQGYCGERSLKVERRRCSPICMALTKHNVEVLHMGKTYNLKVAEDESILSAALEAGIEMPHDCKLGVCMTCPARVLSGDLKQELAMLSDDVVEKGFALMCSSYPRGDCKIETIEEGELLDEQLVTSSF
eukprot:TRINITY_DN6086_c0_g3_i1.p1 TRINITY_DN6086_c0_g3~~TRINITY_DN6086_c0_g3_i1.p1  ORF type:complete len:167 (-),score=28.16 TRINITY_DN6086_c0_g3_i1:6-506(-)